ncbi:MAG: hypothetical protein MJZ16_03805 [Bacteroidales bacterium]|nr:hypothetical protein [Bacteroidales bacterium]
MNRRIILTIVSLLWTTLSFAQWMPDSTVQVVAYWELGDKMQYQVKAKTVNVDKDGKETVSKSSSEKRIFEVIEQTDNSYVLQTTYTDVFDSQMSLNLGIGADIINAISEATVLKTRTDENGTIEGIINTEESKASLDKIIDLSIDAVLSKYDKKDLKAMGVTKEDLANNYKQMFSEDVLLSTCMSDVAPLLQFHGGRYDIGQEYTVKQDVDNAFGGTVEGDLTFWVDMEDSDSTFVVMRSYMEIGSEEMMPYMMTATINALKQTLSGSALEEAENALKEQFESSHMEATLKQYTTTVIHADTGWTTNWYFDREITLSSDKGIERIIKDSQEIEIVFDDDDE